ncbi:SCO6880 family protein [Streptomyces sp. NPDC000594]|uniref:SCO6880 family protein n=1 Tax=Streptomyces sp. NPDC000594 TaxID=3154261 RepID=UPI0033247D04
MAADRTYVFGKERPTGLVGKRDLGEQILLVGALGIAVALGWVLSAVPVLAILAAAVLVGGAAAAVFVPYKPRGASSRRTFYKWWRIRRDHKQILKATGGVWTSPAIEAGVREDGEAPDEALEPAPGVTRMRPLTTSVRGQDIAVVLQPENGCVTVALEIASRGHAGRDRSDQALALDRWGGLLDSFGNSESPIDRISVLARQLKSDPEAHQLHINSRAQSPATDQVPEWLARSYDALASAVSTSAEEHRYYVVAHASWTKDFAAESFEHGTGDDGVTAVMASAAEELWARCEDAELRVVAPVDLGALTALVRNAYNPDHLIWDDALPLQHAFPRQVDVRGKRHFRARAAGSAEGWYHATAAVVKWPTSPVGPDFLAPLLIGLPDVIRTVAITKHLESNDRAVDRMMSEDTNNQAEMQRNARLGRNLDPRDLIATQATAKRGMELAASGASGSAIVGYLTVSARTEQELSKTKRNTEAKARSSHLRIEWLDLEHHRAFVNTLPFAAGIRGTK